MRPETMLLRQAQGVPSGFAGLSTPVHRASTVIFRDADSFAARGKRRYDGYTYGLYGTPTTAALARKLAALEGAREVVLAPSGLAAVNLVNFAVLRAGDHVLLSDAMYGPTRDAATRLLGSLGVETEFYDPLCGAKIASRLRADTRLLWLESPGTLTMEVQDVHAMAKAARARGAFVAMDNSWATGLRFRPLEHGVHFSVQALTKHAGGHADLLLGSVAVRESALYRMLRDTQGLLGVGASPDDCFLTLRGLETAELRLERQFASALRIARWLSKRAEVKQVIYPALESDAGHRLWKRDFRGAGTVFSLLLAKHGWAPVRALVNALKLFRIGASWGGVHSLVSAYPTPPQRDVPRLDAASSILRLSIGLEHPEDLIADLERGLQAVRGAVRPRKRSRK